ncbi:MAG TPA: hypothetical protein PKY81_10420 [bacterium]|nr:hypothetical protein [bacterium]HPN31361.1 hypothetical protein [bacterium]
METPNIKLLTEINKVIEKNGYSILENEMRPTHKETYLSSQNLPQLITETDGDLVIKLVLNKLNKKE